MRWREWANREREKGRKGEWVNGWTGEPEKGRKRFVIDHFPFFIFHLHLPL